MKARVLLAPAATALAGFPALASPADPPDISADKPHYGVGESVTFSVRSKSDCLLTMIAIGADGAVRMLVPNRFAPDLVVRAGVSRMVPSPDDAFGIRMLKCGDERIIAICGRKANEAAAVASNRKADIDAFLAWVDASKAEVTELTLPVLPSIRD